MQTQPTTSHGYERSRVRASSGGGSKLRPPIDRPKALGLAPGQPLLVLDRTSFDERDVPLEVSEFSVRPEAYEFTFSARDGIIVTETLRSRVARRYDGDANT